MVNSKTRDLGRSLLNFKVNAGLVGVQVVGVAFFACTASAAAHGQQRPSAEEATYLSGIRAAVIDLENERFNAARPTLIKLPKDQRRWEWYMLMEWAGPPIVRVKDLEAWMKRNETKQPQLVAQIRAAAKILAIKHPTTEDAPHGPSEVEAPDRSCRVLIDHVTGRHGGFACVVIGDGATATRVGAEQLVHSKDPSVIVRISTEAYGGIGGVAFTPDSSILLVQAGDQNFNYSEPPGPNLGDNEGEYYIIPIPTRFLPSKAASPSPKKESSANENQKDKTDTRESEDKETQGANEAGKRKTTIKVSARHERDVVAHVLLESADGETKIDDYRYERPWPGTPKAAVEPKSEASTEASDDESDSDDPRSAYGMLPGRPRLNALKLLEAEESKPKRALAAVRSEPGRTEGLFIVSGGTALLERWDLDKNELIAQLGAGVPPGEYPFSHASDWGAAYSSDGKRIFVLPDDSQEPQIFDVASGKLLQTLPRISFAGGKINGAHATFGFSLSGKYVYASIWEQVELQNDIWIAEKRGDSYVPERADTEGPFEPRPGKPSRFVAWSPDDAWCFYVSDESETLRVISTDGKSRSSIPDAVRWGPSPVFDQLPVAAEKSAQGRYALEGLIFTRSTPEPILRLPVEWMDPAMQSMICRNGGGNYQLITGSLLRESKKLGETAATLLLKWWIGMADGDR